MSLSAWLDRKMQWAEDLVNASRYLLALPYFGLVIVLGVIIAKFFQELGSDLLHFGQMPGIHVIVAALELIDIAMAANLTVLIARGSYSVFIVERRVRPGEQHPQFLNHMSTGILKEKLAGSLMGVSSVYLVQVMIHIGEARGGLPWAQFGQLALIHLLMVIGVVALNFANKADHLEHPSHSLETAEQPGNSEHAHGDEMAATPVAAHSDGHSGQGENK